MNFCLGLGQCFSELQSPRVAADQSSTRLFHSRQHPFSLYNDNWQPFSWARDVFASSSCQLHLPPSSPLNSTFPLPTSSRSNSFEFLSFIPQISLKMSSQIYICLIFVLCFLPLLHSRYPCLNDGEPVLLGQSGNEFRCECAAGFFGPFCEYQDTSQTGEPKEATKVSPLFPHSPSSTGQRSWESTFVNLLLCVFFLLLLPSIVVYVVRALYLFLKRCHNHYGHPPGPVEGPGQQNNQPTPPPQYWAAMAENRQVAVHSQNWLGPQQNWLPNGSDRPSDRHRRRRRSESPVTEVTVQLPASICRPLHGTHSACPRLLHQSQSLTLNEFHELLLNIQREMLVQQELERERGRHQPQQVAAHFDRRNGQQTGPSLMDMLPPPPPPPLEPPPHYEMVALSSTSPLNGTRHF